MKNTVFTMAFTLVVSFSFAQQWNGSSNAQGSIDRDGNIEIKGSSGEQSYGQIHITGNGAVNSGDAYISFDEGGEPNSKWSLGARDNGNAFTISQGLTMDAAPKFVITDIAGNVGIGTPNPQGKLHIKGDSGEQSHGQVHITGNGGNGSGDAYISFEEGVEENSKWAVGVRDNGNAFTISNGLRMDDAPKFVIVEGTGNVGIGAPNPQNALDVNGVIHSKEVKVDLNGWPDFVFEEGYELPTLEEVELHIQQKGHLQNVPSEKEVKENGINLGEMDAKLLQKIEELMLYAIQQQKEIEVLKKNLSKLAEKNKN
ncbi:hypothetical protein MNBD_BACTEROID03-2623 [hydrothermal vent metagenome]|uniref:Uncharacterized protein n=1 Tax=hydrothermal vent metagenome TaxID=652676 RepID=A0A3B0SZG1_9ZZZZ